MRTHNTYELTCLCGHTYETTATYGACPKCGRAWTVEAHEPVEEKRPAEPASITEREGLI